LADVLAWEATANNVSCSPFWVEGADVIVDRNSGPMLGQDALAERFTFHKLNGRESTEPVRSQRESADAGEGIDHPQRHTRTLRSRAA
jgi:hypothetical protein